MIEIKHVSQIVPRVWNFFSKSIGAPASCPPSVALKRLEEPFFVARRNVFELLMEETNNWSSSNCGQLLVELTVDFCEFRAGTII